MHLSTHTHQHENSFSSYIKGCSIFSPTRQLKWSLCLLKHLLLQSERQKQPSDFHISERPRWDVWSAGSRVEREFRKNTKAGFYLRPFWGLLSGNGLSDLAGNVSSSGDLRANFQSLFGLWKKIILPAFFFSSLLLIPFSSVPCSFLSVTVQLQLWLCVVSLLTNRDFFVFISALWNEISYENIYSAKRRRWIDWLFLKGLCSGCGLRVF